MKRPLAYITASWGVDPTENTEIAAKYSRKVYDAGKAKRLFKAKKHYEGRSYGPIKRRSFIFSKVGRQVH